MTTEAISTATSVGTFTPLRYRPYRMLVTGRVINTLGGSVAGLALGFAVLDLNHSVSDVGYIVAVRTILNVTFILFGGVIADRLPRNLLMVGGCTVSGLSQGIAATLFLTHTATMPILLLLAGINGMTSAVSQPASAAILPQTVPSSMRKQANALNRLALNAVNIGSLAVAGTLVATVGSGWCVAFDASTFLVAGVFFALIRVRPAALSAPTAEAAAVSEAAATDALVIGDPAAPKEKEKQPGLVTSLREGWQAFISHTWLWVVVLGFMIFNAAFDGGIGVLGLHFADLTVGRRLWSVVLAAETVGALLGALLVSRIKVSRLLSYGTAAVGALALLPLALVLAPNFFVLLIVGFIGGVGVEQFGIAWETTMQSNFEPHMLARVYSYDMLGSFIAMPIGQLLIGPASAAFGARHAMFGVGILMLLAVVGMLSSRSVRQLRHVVKPDEPEDLPVLAPIPTPTEPEQAYT